MSFRLALCLGVVAGAIAVSASQFASAQTPAPAPTPAPAAPPAAPATPAPAPGANAEPGETFGEETTLTAKPIVYVKGTGNWDSAYDTITGSLKAVKSYIAKEGLKTDGQPMTIFTSTDDTGFQYQAAIPIAELPKNPPRGDIAIGKSPEGRALKFVHHGSYDGLDNTYEAITNYLDEKRLEARDMFIEQYATDPTDTLKTNEDHLTVNVLVLVK